MEEQDAGNSLCLNLTHGNLLCAYFPSGKAGFRSSDRKLSSCLKLTKKKTHNA